MPDCKIMRREDFNGKVGTLLQCLLDGSADYVRVKDGSRDLCGIFLENSGHLAPLQKHLRALKAGAPPTNISNAMIYFHAPYSEEFHSHGKIMYVAPKKHVFASPFFIVTSKRFEEMNLPSP